METTFLRQKQTMHAHLSLEVIWRTPWPGLQRCERVLAAVHSVLRCVKHPISLPTLRGAFLFAPAHYWQIVALPPLHASERCSTETDKHPLRLFPFSKASAPLSQSERRTLTQNHCGTCQGSRRLFLRFFTLFSLSSRWLARAKAGARSMRRLLMCSFSKDMPTDRLSLLFLWR